MTWQTVIGPATDILLIVLLQVTLVAAVGLLAASRLRSAAHRHSVLVAAMLCTLASPLLFAAAKGSGISISIPAVIAARPETAKAVVLPRPVADQQRLDLSEAPLAAPADIPPLAIEGGPQTQQRLERRPAQFESQNPSASATTVRVDWLIVPLWCLGTLVCLVGILRAGWRTRSALRSVHPLDPARHAAVIQEAARQLEIRIFPQIGTTGRVPGPAVAGAFRKPWILIPSRYLEALSDDELVQVLVHEGAHAVRRDPLVVLLQRLSGALFWWHPLVHFVNRRLSRAREEVCDNFVLKHVAPETYGATLLRLATLSPGMSLVSTGVGLLDGGWKLEDRIRGILDHRRQTVTRVRWATAVALLGGFALLSTLVAGARVVAQPPGDSSVHRQSNEVPKQVRAARHDETETVDLPEKVDARQFRLILTYHGESDKPYYNMTLCVPPIARRESPFSLFEQINEEQAARIIKCLSASQFFKHAQVTDRQNDPKTGPQYLLRVRVGDRHYQETLGWDTGTVSRLDGIRKTLDGDAAKSMDLLLGRLAGHRKIWEAGEVVNDLKTTISAEQRVFGAGRPIPIKLELTNVGDQDRQYGHHQFIRSGTEIVIYDEQGRGVPYLGGGAGLKQSQVTIKPAETKVIESCDLSSFYYLRRPGRYTVTFRAVGLPLSNSLHFELVPDEATAADGDPMGKLLPLVSSKWSPQGSPNASAKIRPGRNRAEMPGWQFVFPLTDKGVKGSKAVVWLWLTNEPAEELAPSADDFLQSSEYLGKVSRWHAYLHAPPEALEIWPKVKEDLKTALDRKTTPANDADGAASDDDYRLLHDRYKATILAALKPGRQDDLSKLTDQFNKSIGGKLLFVQVVTRVGPIAKHKTLLSKFFDESRKISIGKIGFAASAKPIVSQNHDGQGVVLVATNPLEGTTWPDDLQLTLVMDNLVNKDIRIPPAEPKWGEPKNGLRTRISAAKQVFRAGEPIPVKLEIENVGEQARDYQTPAAPHNHALVVVDERGRAAPYLGGLSQVQVHPEKLDPGQSREMKSFDLAESYYLRRPGRYSVRWPGELVLRGISDAAAPPPGSPASAPFEFDVIADPDIAAAADGDPVGRLLPLVKDKWWLDGGSSRPVKLRPGGNRTEVIGRLMSFLYNPTGYKVDSGLVWLWLTDAAAAEQPVTGDWPPTSEHLGKIDRWHVYMHVDGNALTAWPTAKEDIKQALATEPELTFKIHSDRAKSAIGEDVTLKHLPWGESKSGLRTRLIADKQTFQAGESIPLKLEIENTSDQTREYFIAPISYHESLISVVDEQGRKAPYLGRLFEFLDRPEKLAPGQIRELQAFDLASSYYLRRPGRYTVRFPGEPASAPFDFEVFRNPALAAADGDPVGRLLALVKEGWWLGTGTSQPNLRPGRNWGEVPGRIVRFIFNPPATKNDSGMINIFLTDKPAKALPPDSLSSMPASEYLGKISRWYVYFLMSDNARKAWPTAKEDIQRALAAAPTMSFKIDLDRDTFAPGEDISFAIRLRNQGSEDIDVPGVYWSARVILDGKEYTRLPDTGVWRGPGTLRPQGEFQIGGDGPPPAPGVRHVQPGPMLSQYGVGELAAGVHKLSLKTGEENSNELTFAIQSKKSK